MNLPPDLLVFLGRFHPVLVHLPIGFLILLGALEILARTQRWKDANAGAGIILALTLPACALAAACGWMLAQGGGYDERLLELHQWTGIATTAACALCAILYWLKFKGTYRFVLAGTLATLTVASHFGGSLTHGSNYLIAYAPDPLRKLLGLPPRTPPPPPGESPEAYLHVVAPILDKYCVSCHGPEKPKGGLRVDSVAALLKGGHGGPSIVPGNAKESYLLERMLLPLDDDDHMPPEGKPQPGDDDVALLTWWINAGAPEKKLVDEMDPPADVRRILELRFGRVVSEAPASTGPQPRATAEIQPLLDPMGRELGIAVSLLSQREPWVHANASLAGAEFTDASLARLATLGANLRWLDLGGTAITDDGLTHLTALPNLTRLHLPRTAVTDAGLPALAGLQELELLNLYGTTVTDAGLPSLAKLPRLRQLYLWQTQVTPDAAKAFAEARVDVAQIRRWQDEIAQLQANVRNARMTVDLGATTNVVTASASPVNTECPVSGAAVKAGFTTTHEGRVIGFCCGDCKAAFEKEPAKFADKVKPK